MGTVSQTDANFSKRGEIKTTRKFILKVFYLSFQIKSMDFESFFASAEFKAGLIITIAVVILVVDGFCCSVGSKPKNYQKNMEMLENGSVSEKEPSAPLSDSNGFYARNMEFNGNDL